MLENQDSMYLCHAQTLANTDWTLVAMIPYEAIMQEENTVRGILFSIAFLVIAICGVLILLLFPVGNPAAFNFIPYHA